MPSLTRIAALAVAATLTLAACGSDDPDPAAQESGLDDVSVSETADDATTPEVEFTPGSVTVAETEHRVLTQGDGEALTSTDLVSFDYAVFSATSGDELGSSFPDNPVGLDLADQTVLPGLSSSLTGQKIGSRVLIAVPPAEGYGEAGNPGLGVGGDDTLLFLVDIISAITPLDEATGTAVEPKKGLPTAKVTAGEPATITIPDGFKAPKTTTVQPLIEGAGEKVESGQTVRVAYTGVTTRDGEVFDSSASSDAGFIEVPIGVGNVIKGWDTGLVGQPVGSRVLLVIPASEGYGDEGSPPSIEGGDTLVFVVDILAAY